MTKLKALNGHTFVWRQISVALVCITGLAILISPLTNIQVAEAAGTISGTVYRDYNGNGTQDAGEIGEAGVIARAFDSSDALVGTATSGANGTYSLAHTGNGTIRVEFTIPASACNLASTVDFPSTGGATYGSSVQFVAATQANVNFAFNNPAEFNNLGSVANPPLAISQYVAGDPLVNTGAAATDARTGVAFNTFSYNSSGEIGAVGRTPVLGTVLAGQIGSVWGLAYQKESGLVFASAVTKRHAGFGGLGSGGIYRINSAGATDFINVNTIGIPTGTVTRTATGVNGLPANRTAVSTDADSFDKVGKTGIGGLDLSDDGRFLYLMNLFDDPATTTVNERRLYRLEIGIPAAVPTAANVTAYDLPNPNCVNGVARPWAVKYHRGSVYAGIVCSGENAGGTNVINGASNMNAFVYQMDAATGVFNATPVLTVPLNYQKGNAYNEALALRKWNPWTATFQGTGTDSIYPQPILSDLEFDKDGTLILGFLDRNGMQTGFFQPNTAGTGQFEGFSGGDLLRAYKNPTGCAFQLESNGKEGAASAKLATGGAGNNQGPGGGEFYNQERLTGNHEETSFGSLAFIPNFGDENIAVGVMDPTRIRSGGVSWMDNTTGVADRDYEIYFEAQSGSVNTQGSFGKSVGLGDIEPLLAPAPLEIGNRVWNDVDHDGIQDPNEAVISGVSLELYEDFNNDGTPDGGVRATTTTSASGNWYFNNANITDGDTTIAGNQAGIQPNRAYIVRIAASQFTGSRGVAATPLAGLTLTPNDRTGNGAVDLSDSDAVYSGGLAQIRVPAMASGRSTHSFDFGLAAPVYSLGNRVFNDANNNGIRETAETGIANATVNLYLDANNDNVADGASIATTTTDASGYYRFDNLAENNYIVGVVTPTGFATSTVNAADPDNNIDNDDSGVTVAGTEIRSQAVTLGSQAEPINEADLSASGQGNFDNQANLTVDFGFFQTASIGDLVFNDTDRDGVQDAGENGVGGVTVTLSGTDSNGVAVNLTTTTATTGTIGSYSFAGLAPGNYTVTVTAPTGFRFSPQDQGGNDALDSDVNASGATASIAVTAGQVITNVDAGLVPVVSIGNQVFNDVNNNGTRDTGETGINGATVNLYLDANNDNVPDGAAIATTTTATVGANSGLYLFGGLAPNNYIVGVVTPAGFVRVLTNGGDADAAASDVDNNGVNVVGNEIRSQSVTLTVGGEPTGENPSNDTSNTDNNSNLTVDFAFTTVYSLGNRVFNDVNNNGLRDAGDAGIATATVNLYLDANNDNVADGASIATTTTDASGYYRFDNLGANNYIVEVITPTGFASSSVNAADPDNNVDNDDSGVIVSGTSVRSQAVTLGGAVEPTGETDLSASGQSAADNQANMTVDFGFFQAVSISGVAYSDGNRNSAQGAGENGIANVTVRLLDSAGNDVDSDPNTAGVQPTTTTTDANGNYSFTGLPAGSYIVAFTTPAGTSGSPQAAGSTANPANGRTNVITLTAGQSNTTTNTGFFPIVSLGNQVFNDTNNNGVRDTGENGIANVTVRLLNSAGNDVDSDPNTAGVQPTTTTTDANGLYLFSGIAPGDYIVSVTIPTGFTSVTTNGGDADAAASDVDNNGVTRVGNEIRSLPVTLTVGGEPTGETPSNDATTTDNNSNLTVDFALTPGYSLGNRVFSDVNNNGIRDAAETGLAGATVNLYLDADNNNVADGAAIATTTTDASGYYRFDNLGASNYIVGVVTPTGFATSTVNAADPDNNVDSDDSGINLVGNEIRSQAVTLGGAVEPTGETDLSATGQGAADNQANMTVDFGFFQTASISGVVFTDSDRDGIQDAGENGVGGLTVTLRDSNGNIVATTTTATTGTVGSYSFPGLAPANGYTVTFTAPNGSGFSPQDQGGNDALDSDTNTSGTTAGINLAAGQSVTTVAAGLVPVLSVGNQVFNDNNSNGVRDAGDTAIAGATVNLYLDANNDNVPDGVAIATTTTDASGLYLFSGLAPNNYIVGVVTPAGVVRSTVNGGDPDNNNVNDNNGVNVVGNETRSQAVTLTVGGEPTGETPSNDATTTDNNSNLSVGFGFIPAYSLGNRIFFDTNNNGLRDAGEVGTGNVQVELLDGSGASIDSDSTTAGVQPTFSVTDGTGYYRFDNLLAATYIVRITPTNFIASGDGFNALVGFQTSTPTETTPDSNVDNNDNGLNPANLFNPLYSTNGILSGIVTLGGAVEPTAEADLSTTGQNAPDNRANMTADFGLYRLQLAGTVWGDVNNSGTLNAGEPGIASVRVRLFDTAGVEIPVGADGLLGTADDAIGNTAGVITASNGNYNFGGLPAGTYTVRIYPASAMNAALIATSGTPDNNVDGDNNGANVIMGAGGYISSNTITLTALAATSGAVTVNNANATTTNPTLDFGIRTTSTAAGVSLSGRVTTANGKGITRVQIVLTDTTTGAVRTVFTGVGGGYRITDLEASRNYTIEIRSKRYQFDNGSTVVSLTGDDTLNFTAIR